MTPTGESDMVWAHLQPAEHTKCGDRSDLIKQHVEVAHREIQAAQRLAYQSDWGVGSLSPLRTRLTLNRVQSALMRLLVRRAKGWCL